MDPHDSNPERRNLSALSLAIIAYYWAGGVLTGTELRLLIVTVHFERPWVLAALVWTMLFWFLYRYWLHHKGFFEKFRIDVHTQSKLMPILNTLVEEEAKFKVPSGYTFHTVANASLAYSEGAPRPVRGWRISYSLVGTTTTSAGGQRHDSWTRDTRVSGLRRAAALYLAFARAVVFEKSASSIAAPYLLFALAGVSGALTRLV